MTELIFPNYSRVVYTAIFGSYDTLSDVNPDWNCDFICFTDRVGLNFKGWRVVQVPSHLGNKSTNRIYKMLAHKYLPQYEQSLYVDGNFSICSDPTPLFEKYLSISNIAIPFHRERSCVYQEAAICIEKGISDSELTEKQIKKYREEGFPERFGLTENGLILRNHCHPVVVDLMELWWCEYLDGGMRDQLSLQYSCWKKQIAIVNLTDGPRGSGVFFKIGLHNSDKARSVVGRLSCFVGNRRHLNWYYFIISEVFEFGSRFKRRIFSLLR